VSIDKSLKRKGRLARTRNVLKRHERVFQLQSEDRFNPELGVIGMPKLRVVKLVVGKKKKKAAAAPDKADKKKAAKKK
jgi:small basic protein (TIGR04137 family)